MPPGSVVTLERVVPIPKQHNELISGVPGHTKMKLQKRQRSVHGTVFSGQGQPSISHLSLLLAFALVSSSAVAKVPRDHNVLILNEVGLSHSLTDVMTQQITSDVQRTMGSNVEFFAESLDLLSLPGRPSRPEMRDWLAKKYDGHRVEVVVAVGPDTIKFLADYGRTVFVGVPIVICGAAADQAGNPNLDSRFTGTWQQREPGKTLEAALGLFPYTRHVFVVGGTSIYDRVVMTATKEFFSGFQESRTDFFYLTDMEMGKLLEQLKNLPENSVVFYTSFFQDSAGNKFLNATSALPMVASAANAPVFGMSDTYLGNGIVGGDLMNFREQGKLTAQIVSELLQGEKAGDIPIKLLPSMYMFDWNELKRWRIPESSLPSGSIVLLREPSIGDRMKSHWFAALLAILAFSVLTAYMQYSQRLLKVAKKHELHLSSRLINAEEKERRRIASELHDDFSQRLAILSLGLENVDEATPASLPEVHRRLHDLIKSANEFSTDLHALSHRLHSSTLQSLGLVPAVAALCQEFALHQGVRIDFKSTEIPRLVHPDTALCVFRIVQEGLRNLKKHSDAKEGKVDLRMAGDRLEVTVRDEGCGFDLKSLRQNEGLGVQSMEERARSLGGKFEIHSVPGRGTTFRAWLPLNPVPGIVMT